MTWGERVAQVRLHGFTDGQAAFLVTVMLHAGVCVGRQYCAFAGIPHGRKVCDFFESLVTRGYATARPCGHHRARLFHIHHKAECFMASDAARRGGNQDQCALAASVGIKRLGLNRCSGARLWRLDRCEVM